MSAFQVSVKVNAVIGVEVFAETPEAALAIAREKTKKDWLAKFAKNIELIDGHEEILGVSNNAAWDLE